MVDLNNNISESNCSLKVSKLLKEKGFRVTYPNDERNFSYWEDKLTTETPFYKFPEDEERYVSFDRYFCPTHALTIEWFKVNFEIHICPIFNFNSQKYIVNIDKINPKFQWQLELYNSSEDAIEAALIYCLTNLI